MHPINGPAGLIRRAMKALQFVVTGADYLTFPAACAICAHPLDDHDIVCCVSCASQLLEDISAERCPRCGHQAGPYAQTMDGCNYCRNTKLHFDRLVCAGSYHNVLKRLVMLLKYNHKSYISNMLAQYCHARIQGAGLADRIDVLVPIPMHWSALVAGRDDIVWDMTCELADMLKVPAVRALRRRRAGPSQKQLSATARWKNARTLFAARGLDDLSGRTVCLVDDVTTTGATLDAAARIVANHRPASIVAVCVAKAQDW